jgi:hypothetical protein
MIVTAGSKKINLWGPQRTPLGILRVKDSPNHYKESVYSNKASKDLLGKLNAIVMA